MSDVVSITLTVNGTTHHLSVEPRRLLVDCLRQDLGLSGTKIGCEQALCGVCVVLLNGDPVKSCNLLAVQADGGTIMTIEGLVQDGKLHPIQEAFCEKHAVQCGYCTPGMILCAHDLLKKNPHPSDEEIRNAIYGNLCRCTGYQNIFEAIEYAGELVAREAESK